MKRMLFNATHQEELRVAIVDGQKLLDLDLETVTHHQKKGNIYKGIVTRVEPSLEAAFVDYGAERQGFLPLKEISRSYFKNYSASTPMAQVRIQDVIKEGQELVLQVEKDERGNKGAALTSFISLAGRFLVLMPNNPKGGGISRRIEGDDRVELREHLNRLDVPQEHALIARTAGIGRSFEEIQWDLDYLLNVWKAINEASTDRKGPFLIYQESNLVVRAIRDYLRTDIAEILIDDQAIYERARKFMEQVMPQNLSRLKRYDDNIPLFSRFQIEHQIEAAFSREVRLSSGGALVIDHTEAVVTIDVNSAKATKGADIEETALQTNLEAADEIARQLRIRDLGGLLVIDMIDMTSSRNQRAVETRLIEALKVDRARVQVGRISRFGLLEMSRQRLRSSLGESNYLPCPRCSGNGTVRSTTSSALSILRILEEEAQKENTEAIHANLPFETATYLLNEKRHEIGAIEKRLGTTIFVVPTATLDTPHFQIKRLRAEELAESAIAHSFEIENDEKETMEPNDFRPEATREMPVIDQQDIATAAPPPVAEQTAASPGHAANGATLNENRGGFFRRVFGGMFSSTAEPQTTEQEKDESEQPRRSSGQRPSRPRSNSSSNDNRQRRSSSQARRGNARTGAQDSRRGNDSTGGRSAKSGDNDSSRSSSRGRRGQGSRRNSQSNRNNDSRNDSNATNQRQNDAKEKSADAQSDSQTNDGRSDKDGRQQRSRRRGRGRGRQSNNNQKNNAQQDSGDNSKSAGDHSDNRQSDNATGNKDQSSSRGDGRGQRRPRGKDNRRDAGGGQRSRGNTMPAEDLPDDIGNRLSEKEMQSTSKPRNDRAQSTSNDRGPGRQQRPAREDTNASAGRSGSTNISTGSGNGDNPSRGADTSSVASSTAGQDKKPDTNVTTPRDTASSAPYSGSPSSDSSSSPTSRPTPPPPVQTPPSSVVSGGGAKADSSSVASSSSGDSSTAAPAVTASPSDYLSPKKKEERSGGAGLVQVETSNSESKSESSS